MENDKGKLREVLHELLTLDKNDIEQYKITQLYTKVENIEVIQYSYIANFLNTISEEDLEKIDINIKEIENKFNCNFEKKNTNLLKIIENIKLELVRINTNLSIKMKMDQFDKIMRVQSKEKSEFEKKINLAEQNIDKTQGQVITILSIFAGIIIAFFGGTNLLANAITEFNKSNKFMSYSLVIIIGIIMFNIIYLLLYSISKIVKIPISIGTCKSECIKCSQYGHFKRIINRYPIAFYFNVSAVWGIFLISYLYILLKENSNIIKYLGGIELFYPIYFISGMILLILMLHIISKVSHKKLDCIKYGDTSNDKEKDMNTKNNTELHNFIINKSIKSKENSESKIE